MTLPVQVKFANKSDSRLFPCVVMQFHRLTCRIALKLALDYESIMSKILLLLK